MINLFRHQICLNFAIEFQPTGQMKEKRMIVIDGRESSLALSNYANLAEVLVTIMEEEGLGNRVVTDVLVDNRSFSELYPHQARDIEACSFKRLELHTISLEEMASDVAGELPKVIGIMARGARRVATLFRESEIGEGLEVLQDIINVTREMLGTIHVLRNQFSFGVNREMEKLSATLGDLLGEMNDVLGNEDWQLVADILEYEYIPACEGWHAVINSIAADIAAAKAA